MDEERQSTNKNTSQHRQRVYAPTHGKKGVARRPVSHGTVVSKDRLYAPTHNTKEDKPLKTKAEEAVQEPLPNKQPQEPSFMKGGKAENSKAKRGKKKKGKRKGSNSNTARKKQRKESTLQYKLTWAIVAVALVALLGTAYFVLQVDAIEVKGNTRYTTDQIRHMSGLKNGGQIYLADLDTARQNLEQDPYLDVLSILRVYPNRIRINIQERQEVAAISYQNLVVIIDKEGYVLSIGNRSDLSGLIRVQGMQVSSYQVNLRLGELTDFYSNTLVAILQALDKHSLTDQIAYLDISNPLSVHMELVSGLDVLLGQPDGLDEKLESLARMMPELERLSLTEGTLHLSAKNDPVYSPPQEQTPDPTPDPTDPADPVDPNHPDDLQAPTAPEESPEPEDGGE